MSEFLHCRMCSIVHMYGIDWLVLDRIISLNGRMPNTLSKYNNKPFTNIERIYKQSVVSCTNCTCSPYIYIYDEGTAPATSPIHRTCAAHSDWDRKRVCSSFGWLQPELHANQRQVSKDTLHVHAMRNYTDEEIHPCMEKPRCTPRPTARSRLCLHYVSLGIRTMLELSSRERIVHDHQQQA